MGAIGRKDLIIPPPYNESRRLMLAEVGLPLRIECGIIIVSFCFLRLTYLYPRLMPAI